MLLQQLAGCVGFYLSIKMLFGDVRQEAVVADVNLSSSGLVCWHLRKLPLDLLGRGRERGGGQVTQASKKLEEESVLRSLGFICSFIKNTYQAPTVCLALGIWQ